MKPLRLLACLFLPTALVLATATPSMGQEHMIGIRTGLNVSDIGGQESFGVRTRVNVGAFLSIGVTDALSIRPEVVYSQKGGLNGSVNGFDIAMDFLEIPVLVDYKVLREGRWRASVFAGPALALSTKCEFEGAIDGVEFIRACDDKNQLVDIGETDLGIVLGGGLSLPVGKLEILLDARYNFGLMDVNRRTGPDAVSRCRTFSLSIGLRAPLAG